MKPSLNRTLSAVSMLAACLVAPITRGSVTSCYGSARGVLPEDTGCWTYITTGDVRAPIAQEGKLALGPTSASSLAYWMRTLPSLSFDSVALIYANLKVDSSDFYANFPFQRSGYSLFLSDNQGRWAMLGISADRLLLQTADQNWGDQTYLINTTDQYHYFGLAISGDSVDVFMDGDTLMSGNVGTGASGIATAGFGDQSLLAGSLTHLDEITVEANITCDPADFNCDEVVDGADLGLLLAAWDTPDCVADLNFDGTVNGADLGLLLADWG